MGLSRPLISVTLTTYNHEKYIAEAVASVLQQTCDDFEVIVVDDGSTDRTGAIVQSFSDPRLRYIYQPNQGPSVTANTAAAACRGKYRALMSGDDVLHPDRLCKQLEVYQRGPTRLLFSGVEYIDDDSRPLDGEFYPELLQGSSITRAQLLERLFCSGPGFMGVTCFSELEVFLEHGPHDPALYQTQDYVSWIRLIKKYDFEIMPDRLYKFRIRNGWENLSGPAPEKQIRARNELYLVMRSFFQGLPTNLFREAFRRHLINPDFSSDMERACEEAFLYLRSSFHLNPLLGVERLYELLHDPEAARVLKQSYRFDFVRFAETLKTVNITNLFQGCNSVVFVDQGDGWRPENMVRQSINPDGSQFRVVFNLERFPAPKLIAWAPFEEPRLGRVKIERFRYRDGNDVAHDLGPAELSADDFTRVDNYYVFNWPEPRLYFAPVGVVKQLDIAGRLEVLSPAETVLRLTSSLAEKQGRIEDLERRMAQLAWEITQRDQRPRSMRRRMVGRALAISRLVRRFLRQGMGVGRALLQKLRPGSANFTSLEKQEQRLTQ